MSAPRRIRAAVVGAGLMGRWHARAVRRLRAELVAIVDPDRSRAASLAREFPGAVTAADFEQLLLQRPLDFAHLCTPLDTHLGLATAAVEAGVHLIVEKPLLSSAAETERLLSLARSRGVRVTPVHQYPFQKGSLAALHRIDRLQPIRHLQFVACSAGASGLGDHQAEGIADDILPHPLSVAQMLLPDGIERMDWTAVRPAAGELLVTGVQDHQSLSIRISMNARPTRNTLILFGDGGTAHLDFFNGFAVFEAPRVTRIRKLANPILLSAATVGQASATLLRRISSAEFAYPGLRSLVERAYDAMLAAKDGPFSDQEILAVARARDRILARAARVP